MPSQFLVPSEPIGSQLLGYCELVPRASVLLARQADSRPPESALIAEQIARLRQQGAAMKQVVSGSVRRRSFIDPVPADSLRLASAFEALLDSIGNCAQILGTAMPRQRFEMVAIACNLLLQCVEHLSESFKHCNADTSVRGRHGKLPAAFAAVHAIESEITQIIQRELAVAGDADDADENLPESIEAIVECCRDLANLLEEISGLSATQLELHERSA